MKIEFNSLNFFKKNDYKFVEFLKKNFIFFIFFGFVIIIIIVSSFNFNTDKF